MVALSMLYFGAKELALIIDLLRSAVVLGREETQERRLSFHLFSKAVVCPDRVQQKERMEREHKPWRDMLRSNSKEHGPV